MSELSRRRVLQALGAGAAAAAGSQMWGVASALERRPTARTGDNPVVWENAAVGSDAWILGHGGTSGANDASAEIQGYASRSSVGPGESVSFHLTSHRSQLCTVAVYRVGHYGNAGARRLLTSEPVRVGPRTKPRADLGSGLVACGWTVSWTLKVPREWVSGICLAVFTSEDGHRAYTPFVVRDTARRSDVLMVLPFTTYQVSNTWQAEGRRSVASSFDRPYTGLGLPSGFERDTGTARWSEEAGYDITYASDVDLHEGRIEPSKYTAIVFSGHSEFWSDEMCGHVGDAVAAGTHVALLASGNTCLPVRFDRSAQGRAGRVVVRVGAARRPGPLTVEGSSPFGAPGNIGSLAENGRGTLAFVAGTSGWPLALREPEHVDARIQQATDALMTRMLTPLGR